MNSLAFFYFPHTLMASLIAICPPPLFPNSSSCTQSYGRRRPRSVILRASLASSSPSTVPLIRFNDSSPTQFSPLICGCYSLAGGHGYIYERDFLDAMDLYARSGFSTFDTADIYGPSEATCGKFLLHWQQQLQASSESGSLPPVNIFTKFVPNVFSNKPTFSFVEQSIHKSLKAIGVPKLDLVQLHWWDYSMKGMLDVALSLSELRAKGLITSIGTTNMSTEALAKIVDAGVPVVSNQVQCSLLDRRPLGKMLSYCKDRDIKLLAYGTLTGGVLTNRYLNRQLVLKTSSLRMYSRILKEAGGEKYWRRLLDVLLRIATRKSVSIAAIALCWVMHHGPIYPIVGMTNGDHLEDNLKAFSITLDDNELAEINEILEESTGPRGDCYELERNIF